ncbi:WAT1-related protein At4g30420-like isoform X2 [Rutidosis leptorrhynchoides]
MGWKSFSLIFVAALIGLIGTQMMQYEGIFFATSSASSVLNNLIPAITFIGASILGLEPINIRSLRTLAKIAGTIVCVTGAVIMTLIKGPKLLNAQLPSSSSLWSICSIGSDNQWLLGCLYLIGGCCCWSFWLLLQVPVSRMYPDHLSLSAWMCFIGTVQSVTIGLFTDPYLEAWKIKSYLQLGSCLFAGIFGSAICIIFQSWIIERKGPVFSAIFYPIGTVIVTIFASMFLQEQIYTGSIIGAFAIITGLYVVLWGKAEDVKELKEKQEKTTVLQNEQIQTIQILDEDQSNLVDSLLLK